MQSKSKPRPTAIQRVWLAILKQLPCSCCDAAVPCELHEPKQGAWWLTVTLCPDCHGYGLLGWHGQKRAWAIRKMDMLDALAKTIERGVTLLLRSGP